MDRQAQDSVAGSVWVGITAAKPTKTGVGTVSVMICQHQPMQGYARNDTANATMKRSYMVHKVALKLHELFSTFRVQVCSRLVKRPKHVDADLKWLVQTVGKTNLLAEGPDF
jgi:hypothetical protein